FSDHDGADELKQRGFSVCPNDSRAWRGGERRTLPRRALSRVASRSRLPFDSGSAPTLPDDDDLGAHGRRDRQPLPVGGPGRQAVPEGEGEGEAKSVAERKSCGRRNLAQSA